MVFNSLQFVVFFLAVLGLYRLLPHRGQNWLLVAASYSFYASWDWRFLGLLIASTAAAYACGLLLGRLEDERRRTLVLFAGIGSHLALLGFFKYFNFFVENFQALGGLAGWRFDALTLKVLLPVGISFYTFHSMSYTLDIYLRRVEPIPKLFDVALFVTFFTQLVAGPILRTADMPRVEVHIIESSNKPGGVGEPGTPPIAPAVANAVFKLTGKRARALPFADQKLA